MNTHEAEQIVNYLLGASLHYAPQPFEPQHMAVWYDHLRDIPADVGAEAARQIVASEVDWPAFAKFRAVAAMVKRGTANERGSHRCECADTGLVAVPEQGDAHRPCGRCNPEGYAKWAAGKYESRFLGHTPPGEAQLGNEHVASLKAGLAKIGRQG